MAWRIRDLIIMGKFGAKNAHRTIPIREITNAERYNFLVGTRFIKKAVNGMTIATGEGIAAGQPLSSGSQKFASRATMAGNAVVNAVDNIVSAIQ